MPTQGSPAAIATALSETDLAAASLALLAQPALWPSLSLPPPSVTLAGRAPWCAFWAARLDQDLPAAEARAVLEAAQATFERRSDAVGSLLCLAAIIESYYFEEGPLDPLDGWIAALERHLPQEPAWAAPELEARVIACGVGILLRDPAHALLGRWAERGAVLVRRIKPGAARLKLATFLLQYHLWRGEFGRTGLIVDAMPGLSVEGLLPGEAILWLESVAAHARYTAQHARGAEAVQAALGLADTHDFHQHDYALHAYGASLALAAHDVAGAEAHLARMRPVLDQHAQPDQTHYWHFHAGLALLRGDIRGAIELARATLANSGEIGGPYRSATHRLSLGTTLLAAGEWEEALAQLQAARAAADEIDAGLLAFSAAVMEAAALERIGRRADALALLYAAVPEAARRDYRALAGWWLPAVVADVVRLALEHDIEPFYLRRLARERQLPAPDPALAGWPWAMTVRGFGGLEVLRDDAPLTQQGGKTAQRPLDLLRAMLAHGTAPLPVATALDWLWPDADVAAQRKAFDAALLRLRRMLGDDRLLRLEGGRLGFTAEWVWTDVHALQALMHRIGSAHGAPLGRLQEWAQQLLELMRGAFLPEEDADWVQAARDRYRQRFVVTVAQLAAHIEPLDVPAAIQLYARAIDIDPLAESLVRRLMRLHALQGDRAEALRVLRACTSMLAVATGLGPSRETLALAQELGLPPAASATAPPSLSARSVGKA